MNLNKESLLVLGGSGFIGRNIIEFLRERYDITSISVNSRVPGVRNINLDLNNSDFSFISEGNFKYVIYLATVSSPKEAEIKPQETFVTNVINIHRFLNKCVNSDVKKIILFSSILVYKGTNKNYPIVYPYSSVYAYSKYIMETLAKFHIYNYSMPITVFRLSNTYGPYQSITRAPYLIPTLFKQAFDESVIKVLNTSPIRDWVFVGDVVEVISRELSRPGGGGIFDLGTGFGRSVGDVARIISLLTGAKFLNLNKPVDSPPIIVCKVNKLMKRINYVPSTSLEDGLAITYNYYLKEFNN